MTNNQFTLVIGKHIFSGNRELTTSYVLDLNNQINIDSFSLNGVKALAKTSLMNSLRSNATFVKSEEDLQNSIDTSDI